MITTGYDQVGRTATVTQPHFLTLDRSRNEPDRFCGYNIKAIAINYLLDVRLADTVIVRGPVEVSANASGNGAEGISLVTNQSLSTFVIALTVSLAVSESVILFGPGVLLLGFFAQELHGLFVIECFV